MKYPHYSEDSNITFGVDYAGQIYLCYRTSEGIDEGPCGNGHSKQAAYEDMLEMELK